MARKSRRENGAGSITTAMVSETERADTRQLLMFAFPVRMSVRLPVRVWKTRLHF